MVRPDAGPRGHTRVSMCRRVAVVEAAGWIGHHIGQNLDDRGSAFRGLVPTHLTIAMVAVDELKISEV
jgi:putative NADH-flavin reductase